MKEKQLTRSDIQEETGDKKKDVKIFQCITLPALLLFWIGYGYALYSGDENNISSYTTVIMIFTLFNANVLFTKEKIQNKVLNLLANVNGILFCVWIVYTIISLMLK